ncbi:hypothetical protein HK405_000796, partial [Cladochytrium tenue]
MQLTIRLDALPTELVAAVAVYLHPHTVCAIARLSRRAARHVRAISTSLPFARRNLALHIVDALQGAALATEVESSNNDNGDDNDGDANDDEGSSSDSGTSPSRHTSAAAAALAGLRWDCLPTSYWTACVLSFGLPAHIFAALIGLNSITTAVTNKAPPAFIAPLFLAPSALTAIRSRRERLTTAITGAYCLAAADLEPPQPLTPPLDGSTHRPVLTVSPWTALAVVDDVAAISTVFATCTAKGFRVPVHD